ncbi:prepilin-type N-terminal cleavage/methylation domain-containing protein [Haloferula sp.]|uniref:prepilin-type N-terminal cleavage/methylation domain-containing protein n=1 Tax=Haloferula sp. TaxID=2497595 RepID=UPI0032A05F50
MKLTNNTKRSKKGMTLLELTVVILVLLSLISILFIGARAWKEGSDKAGCIMNIRNVQQAVRSYQNMNAKNAGDALASTDITGAGNFLEVAPTCPGAGAYTYGTTIPAVGTLYMTCDLATTKSHVPSSIAGW